MPSHTISSSRQLLIAELCSNTYPEAKGQYAAVCRMAERRLRPDRRDPMTRSDLIRRLADGNNSVGDFDRAALGLLRGDPTLPFLVRPLVEGELESVAHHDDGLLAAVVRLDKTRSVIELDLRTDEVRYVIQDIVGPAGVRHMTYPFADSSKLAVVFRQDDRWWLRCGESLSVLPGDPAAMSCSGKRFKFFWSQSGDEPRFGVRGDRRSEFLHWDGVNTARMVPEERNCRFVGFVGGEPVFNHSGVGESSVVLGELLFRNEYAHWVEIGGERQQIFPADQEYSTCVSAEGGRAFLMLSHRNHTKGISEIPRRTDGWHLEWFDQPIPGYPRQVFVDTYDQHLLLVTDRQIVLFSRDQEGGRVLFKKSEAEIRRDSAAYRCWTVASTGGQLLVDTHGEVRRLALTRLASLGHCLPLYRDIKKEDCLVHGEAVHALATYNGRVCHFRWPLT